MEEDYKPAVQHQRRVNPKIHDVIKKEVEKLLDAGLIYPISDSPWVSPVHCVPKKGGFTVVENDENELIPTRLVTGWRVCIDYRKLNEATRKDHFPLPFMDQMLERLAGNEYYCFLDGFSGYFQIPIDPHDQEKTTFTCPYNLMFEFQDTTNSGEKKETKAMVFHQTETEEVSDRFVAPLKLCLEHEVKRGNKVVKKELIIALRGEIYFVKFIINPEEDDVEPGVIFGRSFLCMTKEITDFEAGTVTIYLDIDPFLEETKEEEKIKDDWDHLLEFNIDDIPLLGEEELSPFVCKIGKSSRNKKRAMENLNFFYQDITQEEAAKEALAIRMS
ncbi:reverse transcriptase domain-containing protein [Tanacetum coccineum]